MISEEVGLNDALIAAGIDVLETDLASFIIQLAGEAPSHIVTPGIPQSKERSATCSSSGWGCRRLTTPG